MKLDELGVGKITKQNTTVDVKPGETERQAKKLGLVNGKPKLLHKTAAKNSTPNKLFNLGLTEGYSKDMDEEWFKKETKNMSRRQIAQELECNFNTSGETVIDPSGIDWMMSLVLEWVPKRLGSSFRVFFNSGQE